MLYAQDLYCTSLYYIMPCGTVLQVTQGRENSTVVSISVYQAGDLGSHPAQSACHRKVEFYHCVVDSLPPVLTTASKKAVHVLLCLCNNACLSLHDLHALNRDVNMIQTNK